MAYILVIDDNGMNLELAHDILELNGFSVDTADSATGVVERVTARQPDLILMDLRMPGISGLDALHLLRADETTRGIPVAVLTASAMKGDGHRLLAAGFDAYIQKPIDPSSFADSITSLLNDKTIKPIIGG